MKESTNGAKHKAPRSLIAALNR